MRRQRLRTLGPVAMLLGITAVWGWTFLIVKDAIRSYPVPSFLALRFVVAALLLSPFALRHASSRQLRIGLMIGLPLTAGYLFQTVGLLTTSAANAGLLTGLFVILTPLLDWLMYRSPVRSFTLAAAGLGFAGTALLTIFSVHGLTIGDGFEFLTAIAFAIQIVWLGRYSAGASSAQLAFGQVGLAAVVFLAVAGVDHGGGFRLPSSGVWAAILITGGLASALAFWVQTWVQQRMPASRAAIILLGEPAFAAAFAVWLGGERLGPVQWLGAALILLSLLIHETWMAMQNNRPNGGTRFPRLELGMTRR